MATAKRKQEELGEECDDQEQHDNECSDDDDAKRPRLDLHHQHISHHQLPHHRQWSLPSASTEMNADQFHRDQFDHQFDQRYHFDAASDSEVKKDDLESENNEVNSASTRSEDFDEKTFDKNFSSQNFKFENDRYDSCYSVYPEYLAPRTLCKETNDVPFDLSNWQVKSKFDPSGSKFDQSSSNDREFTNASESSERDMTDPTDLNNTDQNDQADQPINFAYYHF